MAKKKDLKDLGDVYSKLGEEVVVSEKNDMTVGDKDAAVGEAPLEDGGTKDDSEVEAPEEVEVAKAEEVQDGEDAKEEDEENLLKDAQGGINNYMAKKSAFDELYSKVISEDFGMEEQDDLNALGIEDATPDAELGEEGDDEPSEEGEVTVTLDKELAKTLCDLLQAAMGDEEGDDLGDEDVADEPEAGDEFAPEEDNEGAPTAFNTHYNDGKSNKVGNLTGDAFGSQPKVQAANKVATKPTKAKDAATGGYKPLGDSVKNDQKVGATTEGPTTTVTPKNKEVKAG